MIPNEEIIDLGWCTLHLKITDMIAHEVFAWIENARLPTKVELARAYLIASKADPNYFIYANIDSTNPVTMRFAHRFGFREVRRQGTTSVQVWEKDKCKWRSSL